MKDSVGESSVVARWMEARDWKQAELVRRSGLARKTVAAALRGGPRSPKTNRALAAALGVTVEQFLLGPEVAAAVDGELVRFAAVHLATFSDRALREPCMECVISREFFVAGHHRATGEKLTAWAPRRFAGALLTGADAPPLGGLLVVDRDSPILQFAGELVVAELADDKVAVGRCYSFSDGRLLVPDSRFPSLTAPVLLRARDQLLGVAVWLTLLEGAEG